MYNRTYGSLRGRDLKSWSPIALEHAREIFDSDRVCVPHGLVSRIYVQGDQNPYQLARLVHNALPTAAPHSSSP